jgi:tRNA (guanine37-N1)-methyltransferase
MEKLHSWKEKHKCLALSVPNKQVGALLKKLKGHLLQKRHCHYVIDQGTSEKLVIINLDTPKELYSDFKASDYEYTFDYSHLTCNEALAVLLEGHKEIPSSFETVGHIAHINLRSDLLDFRKEIGQIILEKNPIIKTVVNKENHIDSKFREFKMDVIAGDANFNCHVIEHGIIFEFDYSKVYWNSRLSTEHHRLSHSFKKDEIIVDMFAGVGPFAIPSALRGCVVYANDLNPSSYEYLMKNSKLNEVIVHAFNMDARDFVRYLRDMKMDHIVMNLPKTATEFLDVFPDLFTFPYQKVVCHCYTFCSKKDGVKEAKLQVEALLGTEIEYVLPIHNVRDVSPSKEMYCVSFLLPKHCWKSQDFQPIKKKKMEQEVE